LFQLAWKKKEKEKKQPATCHYCGDPRRHHSSQCPVFGKTCDHCGKENHFAAVCESEGKPGAVKARFIHQIMADDESAKIKILTGTKSMAVPIRALPDTGSQLDAICY
jgi:hypothetical protein